MRHERITEGQLTAPKRPVADREAELLEQLDFANKRWENAKGQWYQTRLSSWDEEIKIASWHIDYINRQLDQISDEKEAR